MGKTRQDLTRVDTAWLRMEDATNLMMSSGLLLFDRPLTLEDVEGVLEQRLDGFPRFRMKVVEPPLRIGSPVWELDEHFDLKSHIHRIAVPAPGGPAELQALISDLVSTPLDFTKSPWQLHLIDGVGTGSALLARIHHCMADGIALMHMLWSLTDKTPSGAKPGSDGALAASGGHAGIGRQLLSGIGTAIRHPDLAAGAAEAALAATAAAAQLTAAPPDTHTVLKGRLGVSKRAAWSERLSLNELKQVARVFNATFNDVMMGAVAGGMSAYLAGRDVDVDKALLRVAVPVNLRPLNLAGDLGNVFGLVFLELPLQPELAEDRVREVKRRMEEAKRSHQADASLVVLALFGTLPGWLQPSAINFFGQKASLTMTNVPGPEAPRYMAGHRIRDIMFWAPVSGRLGLGISVATYAGQVRVGVVGDAGLVPDPERIVELIEAELRGLLREVGMSKESPPATRKTGHRRRSRSSRAARHPGVGLQAAVPGDDSLFAASSD
jgi:WS/DGAT/MGAT family acyltransferase